MTIEAKKTEKNPGLGKYDAEQVIAKENWQSNNNVQKFSKEKRNSHIDKKFADKDRKERNPPSAAHYKAVDAHRYTLAKPHGGESCTDNRVNYFIEKEA